VRRLLLLILIVGALVAGSPSAAFSTGGLEVHVVAVSLGDAIYVRAPSGVDRVIDGGNNRDELAEYLLSIGETEIDIVVASHPDADHIRGLIRNVEDFSPAEIWVNGEARTTNVAEEFDAAAAASGATVEVGRQGDLLQLGTVNLEVLHPVSLGSDANDNSLVLRLDAGESSALFTSDLEVAGEAELIAAGVPLDIDFLKVGHHGSRSSTSAPFLAATMPDLAVYSALDGNRFGHPHASSRGAS
jgi:competence protein ComEC